MMDEKMRLTDYIRPPLEAGRYTVRASQRVTQPGQEEFRTETRFDISGHAFTLPGGEIFSCFPAAEESGEFETFLPYIVLENRTFPWEQVITEERDGVPVPWVALIVLADGEGEEQDMAVKQLFGGREGIYFPDRDRLPAVCPEGDEDPCHVVDIPKRLFDVIMPKVEELPLLCHVRQVDLAKTEDSICERDGCFSVICGSRLIPSGTDTPKKSTVHLVSLLGYGDLTGIPDCDKVRLVSLHHWNIYSQRQSEENFPAVAERLGKNCGVMGYDRDTELRRQGYSVKEHITRTGEKTYSLYRSPLLPFLNTEELDTGERHTADGRLIYDRTEGVLDVTYAAAWQLGRMVTLAQQGMAGKIQREREEVRQEAHRGQLRDGMGLRRMPVAGVLEGLLEGESEKGGCHEEDSAKQYISDDGKRTPSVFRGYR